jgi:GNAT superfamily N-acetyltransferase
MLCDQRPRCRTLAEQGLAQQILGRVQLALEALVLGELPEHRQQQWHVLDTRGALIAEHASGPVGYAVYFSTFSSFLSRRGVWLEDLFVRPEHRGAGIGRALLAAVAASAREEGAARLEWTALRWNELALGFYRGLGAETMDEWITHRLVGAPLDRLAEEAGGDSGAERR